MLLFYCLMYLPLFVGVLCWSLFWYSLHVVLSSFAIILTIVTVNELWLFLTVPGVGLQCVIVVFPDYFLLQKIYIENALQT